MPPIVNIQKLGSMLIEKRGERGIREVAKEIGVSPATLSRVERGLLPDLETFSKICDWLKIEPSDVLGLNPNAVSTPKVAVHFKKAAALAPSTAQALAQMVMSAHRAWLVTGEDKGN
jgi:transcriptional regulator with XRE-family HTH domain